MRITTAALKLGGAKKSDGIDAFMDDFHAATTAHPFNHRVRILDNKATVELGPFNNAIHLTDVVALNPKQGAGNAVMKLLTGLADKHKVPLDLFAKAYAPGRMTTGQLKTWYTKHGFKSTGGGVGDGFDMVRKPK